MKNKIAKLTSALAFTAIAGVANAQVYGEATYSALKFDVDGFGSANISSVGANVGYELNKNLAVEGMLALGVKDDDLDVFGAPVNVDPKHAYGVFLKPKASLGENFELYAKLGWAKSKLDFSGPVATVSDGGSDFAYGVGAQYNLTPKVHLTGGYMNLYDKDGVTVDGWNFGVGYKF